MRLLHILPTLRRRGAQMFAADLCRALHRSGVSQRLAVLAPSVDEVGISAEIGEDALTLLPRGWRGIVGVGRIVRLWRPHVVFAHGGEPLRSAVLARAFGGESVLVYRKITLTEQFLRRPRWLRLRYHRFLAGRVDAVVTVGSAVAAEVITLLRVPPEKVRLIYQGVAPGSSPGTRGSRERVRAAWKVPPGAVVLLSVGALSWEKNQDALLRVFAAVRARVPGVVLVLAGEGPLRARLERTARELGLAVDVRFLGLRRDVPELLGASDIFLLASLAEGLPGALIEAGLAGLPSVAWDVASVREVILDGVSGFVPPFRDEAAFAAAVLRLLDDPAAARRMGAAAGDFCRERFSMDRCVEEHLRLFRDLLVGRE